MALSSNEQISLLKKEIDNLKKERVILIKHSKDIDESLTRLEESLKSYRRIGSVKDITDLILESADMVSRFNNLKSKNARLVNESRELNRYKKLGSVRMITESFKEAEVLLNQYEDQQVTRLSEKYDTDKSIVRQTIKMCESTGKDPDRYLSELRPSRKAVGTPMQVRRKITESTIRKPEKRSSSLSKRLERYERRSNLSN